MSAAEDRLPSTETAVTEDDPRVVRAVQEYLAAMEGGNRPNRQAFLVRHKDVAVTLGACLDALEFVQAAAPRLDEMPRSGSRSAPACPPSVDPALPLGDFRILREIGRGGMGIVYEAEQLSLGRRVALKVLPFAWTLDPRQLRRFQNEARAVAHLHHTNIVPIHSVGTERGVHFYAMQYIEGRPLAAVIQELRETSAGGPAGPPVPISAPQEARPGENAAGTAAAATLTTERTGRGAEFFRAVARLGVQAAEALEHAHEQGVVHRDVKPGNLLIDAHGHLWVSDFGLAQIQGDTALTVTGDVVGTLRYMSPEQALAKRGLVDHRTDVYSLGATLYELLTLAPVFNGRDREELLRQIAFEEPRAPRRLNSAVPTDLETIVLKALTKRVEDRYTTAQELADDLRRFLGHRPILARRPSARELVIKWFRRHPPVVAAAVVVLLIAAVGCALSTVMIARAQWRTKAALEAEAEQRARAEKTFRQARQAVDRFVDLSENHMAYKPELQEVRRRLLYIALEYYEDFIDQRGDDPSLRPELVLSHLRVATILDEMGSPDSAMAALDRAGQPHGKPPKPPPVLSRGGHELFLLTQLSVQQELKLSDNQVRMVIKASERRREAFGQLTSLKPEVWREKFEEKLEAQQNVLDHLLLPDQARRLHQIVLQQRGTEALGDPEIAKGLRISQDQMDKIRALRDEAHHAAKAAFRSGDSRADVHRKADEIWRATKEQIVELLSDEQRAGWQEMIGQPFTGEIRPPWRDGPRGPREPK
jgi:serine/threonine protein kinase